MADKTVFGQRSEAQWRDIVFPVVQRDMRFGFVAAKYPILYRTEMAENLLVQARLFTYHIPFTDGLAAKPYDNFFTRQFPKFYAAFHNDRSVGALNDPVYGGIQALPGEWDEVADANADRYGVKLRVSFLEYVSNTEEAQKTALVGAAVVEARNLDTALTKVNGRDLPRLPRISFGEMIGKIQGLGDRLIRAGNKAIALLHDVSAHCESLVATFDKLKNPQNLQARAAAQRLGKVTVEIARRSVNPAKEIEDIMVNSATTMAALAQDAQMSIADFLAANPTLVRKNKIPAGTVVKRYRKSAQPAR